MQARHRGIDAIAFAAALIALAATTLWFFRERNGAAVVMCGLCIVGVLGGRVAGVSGATLLGVALGLAFILWLVWVHPPGGARKTSALAHGAGGALAGWAFAITLRRRLAWPLWAIVAMAGIVALTFMWELGELAGDRVLDTSLIADRRDSELDIFFGCLGGAGAIALIGLLAPRRAGG